MAWPKNVDKSQLKIEYYRGTGAGGQHRNKTDSACRITHKETGISAKSEDQRSQHQNRKLAFRRLADRLIPLMKKAAMEEITPPCTDRIRTYNFKRNTVKDDRVDGKVWNLQDILEGNLDDLIESVMLSKQED